MGAHCPEQVSMKFNLCSSAEDWQSVRQWLKHSLLLKSIGACHCLYYGYSLCPNSIWRIQCPPVIICILSTYYNVKISKCWCALSVLNTWSFLHLVWQYLWDTPFFWVQTTNRCPCADMPLISKKVLSGFVYYRLSCIVAFKMLLLKSYSCSVTLNMSPPSLPPQEGRPEKNLFRPQIHRPPPVGHTHHPIYSGNVSSSLLK